jgi:hypothetical protein
MKPLAASRPSSGRQRSRATESTRMKKLVTVVIGLGLLAANRAVAQMAPVAQVAPVAQPAASLGLPAPAASLGLPVAPDQTAQSAARRPTFRGKSPDPLIGDYIPAAQLGPISDVRFGPDGAPDASATPQERYNWGLQDPFGPSASASPSPSASPATPPRFAPSASQSQFGEKIGDLFSADGKGFDWGHFKSDHCFDDFISPVTNPFLNEDPRALTELRPIFMFQTIPGGNAAYHGGNVEWFGVQARLAITERLSVTLNKLGGISINPGSGSELDGSTGFSEIWIGPKYTWYRDDQTNTISAAGLIFQTPTGSAGTFQNTSGLSLTPYANIAQRFGKTSWGTFNFMDTLGFSFATSGQRSDYVYNSAHVDFDVANWNRIFPLVELNWFQYFTNGSARPLGFEGGDLANVGSAVDGHDFMSIAVGARYKFSEPLQVGLAVSFPLWGADSRDLQNFRLTVDMIWRY